MSPQKDHIARLFAAELQFRLASAVKLAVFDGKQPLDLPMQWSHGKHVVEFKEVALRPDQADVASEGLQRTATFLMALTIRDALTACVSDPRNDHRENVRSAYQIARMIRNAFAHGPIDPHWSIDQDCENSEFTVEGIIALKTTGLHGIRFEWRHYGGPLALLRLSQFVRFDILGDTSTRPADRVIDAPKTIYYQQGSMIAKKID
jgi:hypothetical protein